MALFFFTATVVSRVPFRSRTLFSWDSVSFALAMDRFDMCQQRPHPPGYILYIGAGRLFELFTGDPNNALVALSIFSAALAVAGIYLVGRSIFSHTVGVVAAVLLF
ncbi:MAG: glycosyl transferase, partial [Thermoleophilia bacterium]